jgi:uncharacterized Zn-binding protein involved in type VI secretion
MLPAARHEEQCLCPAHGLGVIDKSAAGSVETNGRGQARGGDTARCACGPSDFLVTGSGSVTVNSQPAARMSDKTMHHGLVVLSSGDVVIGGPTVGATLGNEGEGDKNCKAMAAGREPPQGATYTPGGTQIPPHHQEQSYGNCGVESCRQIIHRATGRTLGQEELLYWAIDRGLATGSRDPAKLRDSGGTLPANQRRILEQNGVPAAEQPPTAENAAQAVAEGRGVIFSGWCAPIYDNKQAGTHAVVISGVEYDEHGEIKSFILCNSGDGNCDEKLPASRFQKAIVPSYPLVVTKDRLW